MASSNDLLRILAGIYNLAFAGPVASLPIVSTVAAALGSLLLIASGIAYRHRAQGEAGTFPIVLALALASGLVGAGLLVWPSILIWIVRYYEGYCVAYVLRFRISIRTKHVLLVVLFTIVVYCILPLHVVYLLQLTWGMACMVLFLWSMCGHPDLTPMPTRLRHLCLAGYCIVSLATRIYSPEHQLIKALYVALLPAGFLTSFLSFLSIEPRAKLERDIAALARLSSSVALTTHQRAIRRNYLPLISLLLPIVSAVAVMGGFLLWLWSTGQLSTTYGVDTHGLTQETANRLSREFRTVLALVCAAALIVTVGLGIYSYIAARKCVHEDEA